MSTMTWNSIPYLVPDLFHTNLKSLCWKKNPYILEPENLVCASGSLLHRFSCFGQENLNLLSLLLRKEPLALCVASVVWPFQRWTSEHLRFIFSLESLLNVFFSFLFNTSWWLSLSNMKTKDTWGVKAIRANVILLSVIRNHLIDIIKEEWGRLQWDPGRG